MKEWLKEFFTGARGLVAYVTICFIVAICSAAFAGSSTARTINETVDLRIDSRVEAYYKAHSAPDPVLIEIKKSVDYLVSVSTSDYIVKIDKQIEKMKNDPKDIKIADIKDVLDKWNTFPESNKTDSLVIKYNVIKEWYAKNQ